MFTWGGRRRVKPHNNSNNCKWKILTLITKSAREILKPVQDVIQASVGRIERFDIAQWAVICEK